MKLLPTLYLCVYACVCVCVCTCVHACVRTCVHACVRTCVHACVRTCVHACIHVSSTCAVVVLQVHSLLLRMLVAGLDQQLASSVISLSHSVVPHTLLLSDLITEALTTSLTQLKYVACLKAYSNTEIIV